MVSLQTVKNSVVDKENKETEGEEPEKMDDGTARVYNKKTMRDQYGNYPVWMNRRKILKHKKGRAKSQKASKVKNSKKLTRRQKKKSGAKS